MILIILNEYSIYIFIYIYYMRVAFACPGCGFNMFLHQCDFSASKNTMGCKTARHATEPRRAGRVV